MSNGDKVLTLQAYMKELVNVVKGTQELVINGNDANTKEIEEIKEEIKKIKQQIDKLTGSVELINAEGKLKTSYKDYSDADIYVMHELVGLSWQRIADLIGCSKSTVTRKSNKHKLKIKHCNDEEHELKIAPCNDKELQI